MKYIILDLLEVSAAMGIIIAAVTVLSAFIDKKFSAKWKYWIWLFIAARLAVPFSPDFDFYENPIKLSVPDKTVYYHAEEILHEELPGKAENITTPDFGTLSVVTTPQKAVYKETSRTVLDVLGTIWIGGGTVFIIWYIGGYFFFRNRHLKNSRPAEEKIQKAVKEAKNRLGIRKNFETIISQNVTSPMIMGFLKPRLILPEENFEPETLDFILRHELTHYKRHDTLYKALLLFVNALHWFNPMVWVMRNLAGTDLELSCDSAVVNKEDLDIRKKYSEAILSCVHREKTSCTVFSTHFYGGTGTLKKRFKNIFNTKKRKNGAVCFAAVLALTAVLGGVFSCSAVYDEPTEGEIEKLLIKADAIYQRGNYDLFEDGTNLAFVHNGGFYYSVNGYEKAVKEVFSSSAIENLEKTLVQSGLPLYIKDGGTVYKLRAETKWDKGSRYEDFHWIKLVDMEENRFTYDVCHSGTAQPATRSKITIINERGTFLIDKFEDCRNYYLADENEFVLTETEETKKQESEQLKETLPEEPKNPSGKIFAPVPWDGKYPETEAELEADRTAVMEFLEVYPDPLEAIANISTAYAKKVSPGRINNPEIHEITEFLYAYYSVFSTLDEPDFSEFEGLGGDFEITEQLLRYRAARQRIDRTFWKKFELDINPLSRGGRESFGIVYYEIECTFTAEDNNGNTVTGTDYWDISLGSRAFTKAVHMGTFAPSEKYESSGIYHSLLERFEDTEKRFLDYAFDYRKIADCAIAEYYLGIQP